MTHSISVLLVDDDIVFTETLQDVLHAMGYRVDTAASGPQAVSKVRNDSFNLIVLDLKLPGMSGVDIFRELRRMNNKSSIVMMTAYSPYELAEECLRKGSLVRFSKPPSVPALRRALQSMAGRPVLMVARDGPALLADLAEPLANEGFGVEWAGGLDEAIDGTILADTDVVLLDGASEGLTDTDALALVDCSDPTAIMMIAMRAAPRATGALPPRPWGPGPAAKPPQGGAPHPAGGLPPTANQSLRAYRARQVSTGILACFQKPLHLGELMEILESVELQPQ